MLGKALFQGALQDAFVRALASSGDDLRVLLFVEDERLKQWRWERLYAPLDGDWQPLMLSQRAPLTLYLPSAADRRFPPIGRRDLRALIVASSPAGLERYGLDPFDVAAAVAGVRGALGPIPHDVLADLPDAAGAPTLDALAARLAVEPYTLLHLVCHGHYMRDTGETAIYLAGVDGQVKPVAASELIGRLQALHGARGLPHLAFLATCESAHPEAEGALGGLGQRLVRDLGMPAVVAMTDSVSVKTADQLTAAFYPRLQQHGEPDRALVEACIGLAARDDIAVPALYSRLGGRPLFSHAPGRDLTAAEIEYGLQRLANLLPERAPALQDEFSRQAGALTATLLISSEILSEVARQERAAALHAVGALCQETVDVSFHALAVGDQPPAYDGRCPFPGLAAFSLDERKFFFGREPLVAQLASRLAAHPFLALSGPSGSGKSSLLFAGLIPALQQQEPGLSVAAMRPGNDPAAQLETALVASPDAATLLVVDQLEELFTLTDSAAQRQAFVDRLLVEMGQRRVVLTMRGDFVDDCAAYPGLYGALQTGLQLVSPLTQPELRSAMEQQAAVVGLRFEADLANTILDAVAGEPGAMPLLQHLLRRLWERRHGRWLRAEEYRKLGGVTEALAGTAETIYNKLTRDEQLGMRHIFARLVRLDENDERRDARWRVAMDDLMGAEARLATVLRLINLLADERLVVTSTNAVTGRVEVELTHEALISQWGRFQRWIAEDRSDNLARQQISQASEQWRRAGQDSSYLLRQSRLRAAETWRQAHPGYLNPTEAAFLQASLAAERQAKVRRVGLVAALVLLPLLAVLVVMRWAQIGPFAAPPITFELVDELGEYNLADVVQAGNGAILAAISEYQGQPAKIARSEDGGLSWTLSQLAENDAMTDILPSALVSETLYAASAGGKVFVSTDYGSTWSSLASNPPVTGMLSNIAQSDTGELFAGDFDGAVFRSSDNGATWAPVAECPASGINYLVWTAGALLIGSDNGLWQWTPGAGCTPLADASHGRVFTAAVVGDAIFFGGTAGLYKITNGQVQKLAADQVMFLGILPGMPPIAVGVNGQQLLWWRTDGDAVQPLYRFPDATAGQPSGDGNSRLWVVTNRGLYSSDLGAWLAHTRD